MTRFMITLEEGVELVWLAFEDMIGGEIYVKKIPSIRLVDIAAAVSTEALQTEVGLRPGEKLHELMIASEDAPHTYEFPGHFKVLPAIHNWSQDPARIKDGKPVPANFCYSSETNEEWMSAEDLRIWIRDNRSKLGHDIT